VLDTESSIHIDNTGQIPRAFKRGMELPIQCQFIELKFVVCKEQSSLKKATKKKTQITSTVEMLSLA